MNTTHSLSIRITKDLDEALEQKALSYDAHKSSLASLCTFVGFFTILKVEEQVKEIGDKYHFKDIISRLANNQDIGAYGWNWSIKTFLRPAIMQMSAEEFCINGLKNLKSKKQKEAENFEKFSKISVGVKNV